MEFKDTWHHNRTTLATDIEKYYKGRKTSNTGIQYVTLKDGMIVLSKYIERRDILLIRGEGFGVFVNTDGSYDIQYHGDPDTREWELTEIGKDAIAAKVREEVKKNLEYIQAHDNFFSDRPWLLCDGKTPEEAIEILRPYEFHVEKEKEPAEPVE
jgi:hypothetical protein